MAFTITGAEAGDEGVRFDFKGTMPKGFEAWKAGKSALQIPYPQMAAAGELAENLAYELAVDRDGLSAETIEQLDWLFPVKDDTEAEETASGDNNAERERLVNSSLVQLRAEAAKLGLETKKVSKEALIEGILAQAGDEPDEEEEDEEDEAEEEEEEAEADEEEEEEDDDAEEEEADEDEDEEEEPAPKKKAKAAPPAKPAKIAKPTKKAAAPAPAPKPAAKGKKAGKVDLDSKTSKELRTMAVDMGHRVSVGKTRDHLIELINAGPPVASPAPKAKAKEPRKPKTASQREQEGVKLAPILNKLRPLLSDMIEKLGPVGGVMRARFWLGNLVSEIAPDSRTFPVGKTFVITKKHHSAWGECVYQMSFHKDDTVTLDTFQGTAGERKIKPILGKKYDSFNDLMKVITAREYPRIPIHTWTAGSKEIAYKKA